MVNGQRTADEEYIINGCKVRLYYAEQEKEDDEAIMKTIEQYSTESKRQIYRRLAIALKR